MQNILSANWGVRLLESFFSPFFLVSNVFLISLSYLEGFYGSQQHGLLY